MRASEELLELLAWTATRNWQLQANWPIELQ
jgi:hypothetical protein